MHDAMKCLQLHNEELHTNALVIDRTAPPRDRPFPVWETPPMKDFEVKEYLKKEAAESVGQDSSTDFV